jgi:hypothetical protein
MRWIGSTEPSGIPRPQSSGEKMTDERKIITWGEYRHDVLWYYERTDDELRESFNELEPAPEHTDEEWEKEKAICQAYIKHLQSRIKELEADTKRLYLIAFGEPQVASNGI